MFEGRGLKQTCMHEAYFAQHLHGASVYLIFLLHPISDIMSSVTWGKQYMFRAVQRDQMFYSKKTQICDKYDFGSCSGQICGRDFSSYFNRVQRDSPLKNIPDGKPFQYP